MKFEISSQDLDKSLVATGTILPDLFGGMLKFGGDGASAVTKSFENLNEAVKSGSQSARLIVARFRGSLAMSLQQPMLKIKTVKDLVSLCAAIAEKINASRRDGENLEIIVTPIAECLQGGHSARIRH